IVALTRGHLIVQGQLEVQQQPRLAIERITREGRRSSGYAIYDASGTSATTCTASSASTSTCRLKLDQVVKLTAAAASGQPTITVDDAVDISAAVNNSLTVGTDAQAETKTVSSVSGSSVTFTTNLSTNHVAGEAVYPVSLCYIYESGTGRNRLCRAATSTCSTATCTDGQIMAENITSMSLASTQTTLTVAVPEEGASSITVASASGFTVGDKIDLVASSGSGETTEKDRIISSCNEDGSGNCTSTTITLDSSTIASTTHSANTTTVWIRAVRLTMGISRTAEGTEGQLSQTWSFSTRVHLRK
ncbi:MAG: hypothetical protein HY660_14415, partial [Armatimonadetes bacterium]|nr:hypothetical protein [Armatimonadota bacterium]